MTNREQIAWAFGFGDYDNREIARMVSDMLDAVGVAYLDSADCARLEKWLGLECEPDTNNWGVLEEEN
ncbi:MAG: hypothetical protein HFE44_17235 [Oscillospiraceae bacterium]|nr:hypothetical protein [Oscillospiraceae bacterium]